MQKKIIEENVKYLDGKRITEQHTETVTTLADDMSTLANYHGTLAALQFQLEQTEAAQIEPSQKAVFDGEAARIKSEMQIVRAAIDIQGDYIKGFEK